MGDSRVQNPLPVFGRTQNGVTSRVTGLKNMNRQGKEQATKAVGWPHFIAGGVGGMVGATVTCPLEVIKTRLQSREVHTSTMWRQVCGIAKNEGIKGFWKGLGPMVVGVVPARATYFASYDGTKQFCRSQGISDGMGMYMISAVVAGFATCTLINPIWVVKTRIQLQRKNLPTHGEVSYKGSWHAARTILKEEGLRGFTKGLVPSYWGISESALQFVLYEKLKERIGEANKTDSDSQGGVRSHQYIGIAGLSKLIAALVTYPHEVIRTRMRERDVVYTSALQCVRRVWAEEGVRGLYGGMIPHLLRVVPNSAIIFFTYEHVSKWLQQLEEDGALKF